MQIQLYSISVFCACLLIIFAFVIDNEVDARSLNTHARDAALEKLRLRYLALQKKANSESSEEGSAYESQRSLRDAVAKVLLNLKQRSHLNSDASDSSEQEQEAVRSDDSDYGAGASTPSYYNTDSYYGDSGSTQNPYVSSYYYDTATEMRQDYAYRSLNAKRHHNNQQWQRRSLHQRQANKRFEGRNI